MSLLDVLRRRFARAPEVVRLALPAEEQALAWGPLVRDDGWLVATPRGLRRVGADGTADEPLPWHEIGSATWTGAGEGGTFVVTPLAEVEPGVQARLAPTRHTLTEAGDLPAVVRRRVDQTVVASRRVPLPERGGVLLVARRVPGQPGREWTVVFDDDAQRADPAAREVARQRLAEAVAAEQPD
ncbi:hypothetical protein [Blastococcus sp. CCUG 61487]|uniref:hypothetical protein n=1 Tax=Blastococcus sp. CCUG 61487 TaxID=1840703 RepID=UPI0010C0092D|nr:hypothetical protein [Blastococcus sp. CCUG 61487]TKJ16785.1 hypothetical protein A6V29_12865 [Blastococcus sp. CCUG 61487]